MKREKHVGHDTCVQVMLNFLCCFTRQISRVLHLVLSHGRSGNYARHKGIFRAIRDKIIVRENN